MLAGNANSFDNDGQQMQFSCQASNATPRCYVPAQILQAYNIQALLNKHIDGMHAVTCWGSPNVANLILGRENIIAATKANPPKGL